MARKYYNRALLLLMVWVTGFTVAAQSASQGVSTRMIVTGVVVNASEMKEPVVGAQVRLKGTDKVVITDLDGRFKIEAQLGDTLSVKHIGCDELEVAVDAQQLRISIYNFVSGLCCGDNLPRGVFGIVRSEDKKPLQGVTVTALPSGNCDITNSIGYFNITKKDGDKSLRIEHPAYKTIQGRINGNCYEIWLERNIVTGVVLSAEDGEPVIGAHICAKGTKNGTASDFDGKFSICVTDGTVLTVSCPGLKPQEIVADSRQPMTVVLETDENAPDYLTSSFNVIGIIRMDSLDYVLPENEFLIAQKYNKDLQGEFYQLRQTDIGRAKWLLDREITRRAYLPGTGPMPLENYAKQYFGVKRNGHRLIYINLVAKANLEDHNYINYIDKELVIVFDGGDKYGRALIDLDTEGIVYILINGPKPVLKN